jgi:branched-chain amino acid transport system substrate-binding protein
MDMTNDNEDLGRLLEAHTSRRRLLKGITLTGVGLAFGAPLLAACGSDDDSSGSASTDGGGTDSTGTTGGTSGGASSDAGAQLAEILGIDPANAGGGETWQMGAVLALTGPGAFYGKTMTNGINLATKHIAAAGGPTIEVTTIDHKSGDAQAGVDAMRELISKNVPAKLASYVDNLGSMLPQTAESKMFTLDGGGGTSIFGQGQPYFYGTRAITPNDALPGVLKYLKETNPDANKLGYIMWDLGEPINTQIKDDLLAKAEAEGFEFNGLYEVYPVGASDYSTLIPKIKANLPDVLIAYGSGQDPGHFASQWYTSGGDLCPFIGFELTPDGVNAAKGAYDEYGFTFAADYFDENVAVNPLARLFLEEFRAEYGEDPDFYAANFYENTLAMWDMIRRVLAKGGDINSGEELDAAFQDDLSAASVYGGDETTVGRYEIDPVTHSVIRRPMGVFERKDGVVTPLAYYNINGDDFRMA